MRPLRIVPAFLVLMLLAVRTACALDNSFQVRLLLRAEEAEKIPHSSLKVAAGSRKKDVPVSKERILTPADVRYAVVEMPDQVLKELPEGYGKTVVDGFRVLHPSGGAKINLSFEPAVDLLLTEDGRKKWAEFTQQNQHRKVAVFGGGRVLSIAVIMEPMASGRLKIVSLSRDLNEVIRLLERMGLKAAVAVGDGPGAAAG